MKITRALLPLAASQLMFATLGGCGVDDGDGDPDDSDDDPAHYAASLTPNGDLVHVPRVHGQTQADIDHARQGLQCLRAFMQNTYGAATARAKKICGLPLEVDYSDEYVALYAASDPRDNLHPAKTRRVVLSFTGTHKKSDWIRNIQSQFLVYPFHTNPMTGKYQYGAISAGWTDRWLSQATKVRKAPAGTIVSRMKEHAQAAENAGEQLVVYVVGHSLGAAVSDVAGYDISEWLRLDKAKLKQEVVVASFNMPRYGYSDSRDPYKSRMLSDCTGPTAGRACLTRWAMTRDFDPVQSIPVALPLSSYDQILWQTSTAEPQRRQIRTGGFPFSKTHTLSYCPQFYAPRVTGNPVEAVKNHDYLQWEADVSTKLSASHLLCMFRAPGLRALPPSSPVVDARRYTVASYGNSNGATKRVLDLAGGATANGTLFSAYNPSGGDNQKVRIVDAGDQQHVMFKLSTGKCIDIADGAGARAGARLVEWDCIPGKISQRWSIYQNTSVAPEGFWIISAILGTALCMDVLGGNTGNAAPVGVSACYPVANSRRWTFQGENGPPSLP
jgi:hypothetical protein